MPSLRRTASSPSVRSSPYPSSSPINSGAGTRGNGHRRSSGSETSNRRVLADIEWWRVADGQHDVVADQELEDRNRDDQDHVLDDAPSVFLSSESGVELSSSWVSSPFIGPETLTSLPTSQFAALSISPSTPRRHHSRQSSASSLESTPESAIGTLFEGLRLGISDMNSGFFEARLPSLHSFRRNRVVTAPPLLTRSLTFADCLSLHDDHPGHYADFTVSPLSSSPDFYD